MKRLSFILVLVFVLTLVSCGDGDGNVSGGSGDNGGGQGYRIASTATYRLYPTESTQPSTIKNHYDSNGFCTRTESFNPDGTLSSTSIYSYNDSRWRIRRESNSVTGNTTVEFEYEFGENSVRIIGHYSGAGTINTLIEEHIYSGDRITQINVYLENALYQIDTYNYDSSGRLLSIRMDINVGSSFPQTRIQTYTYDSDGRYKFYIATVDGNEFERVEYTYERGNGYFGYPDPKGNVKR